MTDFFRSLNCCFGGSDSYDDENEHSGRPMVISGPTNFRREEINLPLNNLSEEQQTMIREKAKADAERMWHSLRPLASSPSGTFAERPMPTFEENTTPRPAPAPVPSGGRRGSLREGFENVKAHARKISGAIQGHNKAPPMGMGLSRTSREGSPMEMRSLMDPSKSGVVGGAAEGKMSGESSGVSLDDEVDGSGKVIVNKI